MPAINAEYLTVNYAQKTLFAGSYYNCRALRDIIAYIDGKATKVEHCNNPEVSYQTFHAVKSDECRDEIKRWREIYSDIWTELNVNDLVVLATDPPESRPLEELVFIYCRTNLMLRNLEQAIYRRLHASR